MTRFMKILASLALATALTPLAANAAIRTPLDHVRIAAQMAMSGPSPSVQQVAIKYADYDNIVRSGGSSNQRYPESTGG